MSFWAMRWILMTVVLLVASCEGIKLLARLSIAYHICESARDVSMTRFYESGL